jgi:hypothetical protein
MFTPLKDTTLTIATAGSQLRFGEVPLVPGSKKLNGTL